MPGKARCTASIAAMTLVRNSNMACRAALDGVVLGSAQHDAGIRHHQIDAMLALE